MVQLAKYQERDYREYTETVQAYIGYGSSFFIGEFKLPKWFLEHFKYKNTIDFNDYVKHRKLAYPSLSMPDSEYYISDLEKREEVYAEKFVIKNLQPEGISRFTEVDRVKSWSIKVKLHHPIQIEKQNGKIEYVKQWKTIYLPMQLVRLSYNLRYWFLTQFIKYPLTIISKGDTHNLDLNNLGRDRETKEPRIVEDLFIDAVWY